MPLGTPPSKGVRPVVAAKRQPHGHTYGHKDCPACKGSGKIKTEIDMQTRILKRVK